MNTFILIVGMCLTATQGVEDCTAIYVKLVQAQNIEACKTRARLEMRTLFILPEDRAMFVSDCRVPGEKRS